MDPSNFKDIDITTYINAQIQHPTLYIIKTQQHTHNEILKNLNTTLYTTFISNTSNLIQILSKYGNILIFISSLKKLSAKYLSKYNSLCSEDYNIERQLLKVSKKQKHTFKEHLSIFIDDMSVFITDYRYFIDEYKVEVIMDETGGEGDLSYSDKSNMKDKYNIKKDEGGGEGDLSCSDRSNKKDKYNSNKKDESLHAILIFTNDVLIIGTSTSNKKYSLYNAFNYNLLSLNCTSNTVTVTIPTKTLIFRSLNSNLIYKTYKSIITPPEYTRLKYLNKSYAYFLYNTLNYRDLLNYVNNGKLLNITLRPDNLTSVAEVIILLKVNKEILKKIKGYVTEHSSYNVKGRGIEEGGVSDKGMVGGVNIKDSKLENVSDKDSKLGGVSDKDSKLEDVSDKDNYKGVSDKDNYKGSEQHPFSNNDFTASRLEVLNSNSHFNMLYYYLNNRLKGVLDKVNSIQRIEGYIKELFKKYEIFYFQQKELFKEIEMSMKVDWIGYKLNVELQMVVLINMFIGRITNKKCLEIFKEYFIFDGNDFTYLLYNLSCNRKGSNISRDKGVIKEMIVDMLQKE